MKDVSFNHIKFSHKTADQEAMRIIKEILNSESRQIMPIKGGYEIFDQATGMGFAVSREGKFNGFRSLDKAK